MKTVRTENQRLHIELGNSDAKVKILNQELAEARSQLETERTSREKIGAERSSLKENFAPAVEPSKKLTPDAATILSQLARQVPKICRNAGVMLRKF